MMQRVLSLQMTRNNDRTSSEFVSKRLCCSFLFSVAFLSILGGFLLGRYATDRAILLKTASLNQKQQTEERNSVDIVNKITASVHSINNMTKNIPNDDPSFNYSLFFQKLKCANYTIDVAKYETDFETYFPLKSSKILSEHLDKIDKCFSSIGDYLNAHLNRTIVHD